MADECKNKGTPCDYKIETSDNEYCNRPSNREDCPSK